MEIPVAPPPGCADVDRKKVTDSEAGSGGKSDSENLNSEVSSKSESALHLEGTSSPGRVGVAMKLVGGEVELEDTAGVGGNTKSALDVLEDLSAVGEKTPVYARRDNAVSKTVEPLLPRKNLTATVVQEDLLRKETETGKSWVNIVQKKKQLTKYDVQIIMEDGVGSVVVPDVIFKEASPLWEDFLIGRFFASAPHVAKMHAIVNKIWALGDKSQMIDVHVVNATTMKSKITNPATRNRIIRRGMWNLAEIPVLMSRWSPLENDTLPEVKEIPMWVHLKNVPMNMYSWQGLSFITSAVGIPDRLHPETAQCSNFEIAKIFVKADLSKELPTRLKFDNNLVEFYYPWLPPRCSNCSKWGHLNTICLAPKEPQADTVSTKAVWVRKSAVTEGAIEGGFKGETSGTSLEPITVGAGAVEREAENIANRNSEIKEVEEGEWTQVSPTKSSRSLSKCSPELQFGKVSILSKSRYAILEDEGNDGVDAKVNENAMIEKTHDIAQNVEKDEEKGDNKQIKDLSYEEAKEKSRSYRTPMAKGLEVPISHGISRNNKDFQVPIPNGKNQETKDQNPGVSTRRSTRNNP